ncbi:MAG TPA: HD domain-containing phosphohydrolase [Solirubrobacterales bacterium]|nr:HD domain-containing phosphohydrolase [Solirubrobacterales bacterium]
MLGPSGWRSLVGPIAFVVVGLALLVYDHLNQRVPALVFWLTLGLIVTVFARMIETNRRQSRELVEKRREAVNDRVTGLRNRASLEADIGAAAAAPGGGWILVLLELEGLEAHNDRLGYAAGDEMLRSHGHRLADATMPLGGIAYRVAASRLAVLVPAGNRQLGEIVLAATSSLQGGDTAEAVGCSYGEIAIPGEAGDAEAALQLAGGRLAANRQRRHRSARRQAHAVLMAALAARHPELRENLRGAAYRAISLARRLQLDREQIDDIALAAELQQIGLLAIPESMLERDGLDEGERAMVRSHTAEGERIVAAAPGLASVARLVRSSAEHFDGSGYPDGLSGEAIPKAARVIAVAVAFAALTGRRPHREPVEPAEALAELHRNSGSQFDPRVVEALAAELAEEGAPAATPAASA